MKPYKPPFVRVGNILIDAILNTAHLYGCTMIRYEAGFICFTYQGTGFRLPFSPRESRCTHVLLAIQGNQVALAA